MEHAGSLGNSFLTNWAHPAPTAQTSGMPHRLRSGFTCILALVASTAAADSSVTQQRSVTKVAEGVYAIRHVDSPDTNPQGNTTLIIGERGVLFVDSSYLPSSAA